MLHAMPGKLLSPGNDTDLSEKRLPSAAPLGQITRILADDKHRDASLYDPGEPEAQMVNRVFGRGLDRAVVNETLWPFEDDKTESAGCGMNGEDTLMDLVVMLFVHRKGGFQA